MTYITEQEQIQQIKKWWNQHGNLAVSVFAAFLIGIFGFQYWQQRQLNTAFDASANYDLLWRSVLTKDNKKTVALGNKIVSEYPKTSYASLASLVLAREAVNNNHLNNALTHLNFVISNAKDSGLRQVARLRAARIHITLGQANKALELLGKTDSKGFESVIDSTRGDAFKAMGNRAQARLAYQRASQLGAKSADQDLLLEMKLDDMPSKDTVSLAKNENEKEQRS